MHAERTGSDTENEPLIGREVKISIQSSEDCSSPQNIQIKYPCNFQYILIAFDAISLILCIGLCCICLCNALILEICLRHILNRAYHHSVCASNTSLSYKFR